MRSNAYSDRELVTHWASWGIRFDELARLVQSAQLLRAFEFSNRLSVAKKIQRAGLCGYTKRR